MEPDRRRHRDRQRFYLTIGFTACWRSRRLPSPSTDGWQKRLKRNWKRLHWLIYPAAVLALVHFFIQSKVNVSEATMAAGLFIWLMIWRLMPERLRTRYLGLALLAIGATLVTLVFEVAWYGLVNHVDPVRISPPISTPIWRQAGTESSGSFGRCDRADGGRRLFRTWRRRRAVPALTPTTH